MEFAALEDDDILLYFVRHKAYLALLVALDGVAEGLALQRLLHLVGLVPGLQVLVQLLYCEEGQDHDEEQHQDVDLQVLVRSHHHYDYHERLQGLIREFVKK
jgi:hypothetical protein